MQTTNNEQIAQLLDLADAALARAGRLLDDMEKPAAASWCEHEAAAGKPV